MKGHGMEPPGETGERCSLRGGAHGVGWRVRLRSAGRQRSQHLQAVTAAWSPQPALPHMVVTWMMDAVGGWPGGRETGTVGADMVGLVASGPLLWSLLVHPNCNAIHSTESYTSFSFLFLIF